MKVTDAIAQTLYEHDVRTVFGYQGSSIAHLIDSIVQHPHLEFIEARNEQGAAFAACGYAIATNGLGVALSCSGPGALNMIPGIADAYYDSLPCLFLTGQVNQKEMKGGLPLRQLGFQETDIDKIAHPISKSALTADTPDEVLPIIESSIALSLHERRGPTIVTLPHNIQNADIDSRAQSQARSVEKPAVTADAKELLANALETARRPVVILGGGCAGIPQNIWEALDALNIPIVSSYRGKGIYDNAHATYCGNIGVYGARAANLAVKSSDLLICIGTRLDGRQTGYEPLQAMRSQHVIVFDIDNAELEKHPEDYTLIRADAQAALNDLVTAAEALPDRRCWLQMVQRWRQRYPDSHGHSGDGAPNPLEALQLVSDAAPANANFALDVGQNQLWANNALLITSKRTLLQSAGLGAMGFSVPAGIGAYTANKKPTICITGDGGIQMNIQELQTASAYDIPLKVIIMNNSCLGLIRDYQSKALGARFAGSVDGFGSPDYKLIAQAYGFNHLELNTDDSNVLTEALSDQKPWIIEVPLREATFSYPEPVYGKSIMNQAPPLTEEEMRRIKDEAAAI